MNRIIRVNQQRIARLDRALVVPGTHLGFKGRYKMDAVRPDGRIRPLTGWFDNLITDFGLNFAGSSAGYTANCAVGSGNTAPSNGDTALVSFVANTNSIITQTRTTQPSAPYYGSLTMVYQFAQGAAAGNLAEVGVGANANGNQLWSRALILDGSGNPTTITVLSDEFLNVTYQLQLYPSTTDVTGTVTIGGVNYNYTARSANVTAGNWEPIAGGESMGIYSNVTVYDGVIGAITSQPSGNQSSPSAAQAGTYASGSLYNVLTATYGLNQANFTLPGGVKSLTFSAGPYYQSGGAYQVGLADSSNNGVQKTSSSVMTLEVKVSWGRGTS